MFWRRRREETAEGARDNVPAPSASVMNVTNVEADGVSGKAVAWTAIACLVVGLIVGAWGSYALFRFEPSEEFVETMTGLEVTRAVLADSLERARIEAESASDRARDALEAAESARRSADNEYMRASYHRARADSLQEARGATEGGTETIGLLMEENDALRASLAASDEAADVAGLAFGRTSLAVAQLQRAVRERDEQIRFMALERDALADGLAMANAEIARASGRMRARWYMPKVTVGMGCGFDGCGPVVAVGISVNPLAWF